MKDMVVNRVSDKLTEKQEAFCYAYMESGNASEAYRQAYDVDLSARDSWIAVEACHLLDNPKVTLRLQELQEEARKLKMYSVYAAYDELEEARKLAAREKNPSAAVAAINTKMKLFGLDKPQKVALTDPDGNPAPIPAVALYQLPDNGRDETS